MATTATKHFVDALLVIIDENKRKSWILKRALLDHYSRAAKVTRRPTGITKVVIDAPT